MCSSDSFRSVRSKWLLSVESRFIYDCSNSRGCALSHAQVTTFKSQPNFGYVDICSH